MNNSNINKSDTRAKVRVAPSMLSYEHCIEKARATRDRFLELANECRFVEERERTLRIGELLARVYDDQAARCIGAR